MYLEFGQYPARFEIKKMRCLFLKQILEQDHSSQIHRFFQLQLQNPTKADWVSTCLGDLSDLKINETLEEIRNMSKTKFKNLIKSRILEIAFHYLQSKRGSKGQEIKYTKVEMAEYLLPFNSKLNIEEKQYLFSIRNRMTKIPINYGQKDQKCVCGANENLQHIYSCQAFNTMKPEIQYNEIYNGNLKTQIQIYRRMEKCMEIRNQVKETKIPCDPSDPPNCFQFGFG